MAAKCLQFIRECSVDCNHIGEEELHVVHVNCIKYIIALIFFIRNDMSISKGVGGGEGVGVT